MRLYHYTTASNALLIGMGKGNGLEPGLTEHGAITGFQTMGRPCVWLTKEETNAITPAFAAHYDRIGIEHAGIGNPRFGGPVRCEIDVERSRHLMRWTEFLRTTKIVGVDEAGKQITGREVLAGCNLAMAAGAADGWWINFKPIPTSRIFIPLTREQAIEGCEWQLNTAEGEALEQWTAQRDSFGAMPAGTIFGFQNGECRVYSMEKAA